MRIKVLCYPKDSNPYQELLYSNIPEHVEVRYVPQFTKSKTINNLLLPVILSIFRLRGYRIFHIHWVYDFAFPGNNYISKLLSTAHYFLSLLLAKLLGYKIIWTVHNILPHSQVFINDIFARRFLSKIATTKISHSSYALEEMKKLNINTDNTIVIPHGNYIGQYNNDLSQSEARRVLGLKMDDFIYLFIGNIQKYKGVQGLVDTYLSSKMKKSYLLVAGKCIDPVIDRKLRQTSANGSISYINQLIPDNELQIYLNASDVVVYPFNKITTSGSVMLALSFGKPIIYPRLGSLNELPSNLGWSYDYNDRNGLLNTLKLAMLEKEKTITMGANAFKYARKNNWYDISIKTAKIYSDMV